MQKINLFHPSIFVIQSILECSDRTNHTHIWPWTPQKFFDQLLIFLNPYQNAKNQFIQSVHSSDTVNFRVLSPDWPHPSLIMPTPKILNHLLICVNLCQHPKNQLIPSVHSWDTVNFKVLRPDWPHLFLTMPDQKDFRSTFNFCEFVSTCKILGCFIHLYWRNGWFKNPAIWLAESILAYISRRRFISPKQTTRQNVGQTLFHRTILATTGGSTSTTAVDWHLKVKNMEYNVGLIKYYCITVSVQKISSIHELIPGIQQILGSRELNGHTKPKITEITLAFLNLH